MIKGKTVSTKVAESWRLSNGEEEICVTIVPARQAIVGITCVIIRGIDDKSMDWGYTVSRPYVTMR